MQSAGVSFSRELNGEEGKWLNFYCMDPGGYRVEVSWSVEDIEMITKRAPAAAAHK